MRRLWHDIHTHRLAVGLFGLYWLITALITVVTWHNGMPNIILIPHLIVVIAAAALVAWWRDADEKAVPVCLGVGALISVVQVWVIMFAGDLACWLADCAPVAIATDEEPGWVFLLVLSMIVSVIGCLLGWLVAVILMPVARWLRGRGGPAAPLGGA
jgi:hypothetical protein